MVTHHKQHKKNHKELVNELENKILTLEKIIRDYEEELKNLGAGGNKLIIN